MIKISKRTEKQILAAVICTSLTFVYNVNTTFAAENENVQNEKNKSDSSAVSEVPTYQLDNYVVTANRMSLDKRTTAASTVVIDEQAIERGNFNRVSDALRQNNINVVQNPGGTYAIINGDDRVLVLVNGRKVKWNHLTISNEDNAPVDLDAFPMDDVERIEIVRGPSSSLYGSSAVGGVINLIMKKPTPEQKTTVKLEAGKWNERKGSITTQGGNEDLSYRVSLSKETRDDYDYRTPSDHSVKFPYSNIDKTSQTVFLDKKVGDDSLTFEFMNQRSDDGYGLFLSDLENGIPYQYANQKRTERSYTLTYNWGAQSGNTNDFLRLYHNQEKTFSSYTVPYSHNLKTWGIDLQKGWDLTDNNTLIGGISYTHDQITENSDGIPFDKSAETYALFAEDHWTFDDGWSLNLGSRFEHHSEFDNYTASHISINKEVSPITNVYLSWGQAVNNPSLKMLYANSPYMLGNPDLKQEKGQTITLGFNSQLTPDTLFEASFYSSKVKDALDWVWGPTPIGYRTVYFNIASEKRRGLELNLSHKLSEQWSVRAGYSYAKVEKKGGNNGDEYTVDIKNNRPNGYLLGLTYTQDKWSGDLTWERVSGRTTGKGAYFNTSGYNSLDLGVNYQATDNTKFYLKGYNLTNEYIEQSRKFFGYDTEGFALPGRYFVFGVEHSF